MKGKCDSRRGVAPTVGKMWKAIRKAFSPEELYDAESVIVEMGNWVYIAGINRDEHIDSSWINGIVYNPNWLHKVYFLSHPLVALDYPISRYDLETCNVHDDIIFDMLSLKQYILNNSRCAYRHIITGRRNTVPIEVTLVQCPDDAWGYCISDWLWESVNK